MPAYFAKRPLAAKILRICRYCLGAVILTVFALVALQAIAFQTFHIPSGSMAPTLHGQHRVCTCPSCGHDVVVGQARSYRKAFCPNCGSYPIPVAEAPEVAGDRIQVNKSTYLMRAPWRWEIVVFRLFGTYYIKRLLGLPGEEIRIHDGDAYVNGHLLRKSLAEARAMRVLVFDHERSPSGGWKDRWELKPPLPHCGRGAGGEGGISPLSPCGRGAGGEGAEQTVSVGSRPSPPAPLPQGERGGIQLDGRKSPALLTYRNFLSSSGKCEPIRDEYAYNGGVHADSECVHDFLIETDIEVSPGRGSVSLRLCDGRDWVEVVLPIGASRPVEAFAWPIEAPAQMRKLTDTNINLSLRPKQRYRAEMAFVDRRISLAVDGRVWLETDLPAVKKRRGVERPFQAQADGVQVSLQGFRLYRDIHYGQQGTNAVRGKVVRLGVDQYFMLGDNSANSEDSRFWPDNGCIDASCLIGPVQRVPRN